ncbi:hypothetical protein SAMN06297129_3656 [Pseudooceanicola antarcticus]|uniref:Uncharacterized protein n=1 Tax=Pseudooceanicola antarcticus TaxID=1247613 RepID=A0A285JFE2_9RHOB|nr:hypothetical protein [Pseudooceanicola antarcticus]PJE31015.1 hypothetical protein CVM39_04270 [Pseudooceanicola antarcticus]SNY58965.1 hypothetical protein SAMN06297129_3656 [Pseudooceanicola antarcticus]
MGATETFNIVIVGQAGRLQYEALLFAASLRARSPGFQGRLLVAEPQPGPLWPGDPRISNDDVRAALQDLGAEILPFESRHFGNAYPHGNKIECLAALPGDRPFVFFDSDTLVLDELSDVPFDFDRPSASLRREGTWPQIELYGPGYTDTWRSLYDRFGLDFESSLDLSWPDEFWRRYLYFNAGFLYHRDPRAFGERFLRYALEIRDSPPPELVCQSLDPWLDQVALPLVIHSFGGGRDALPEGFLDGNTTCHYRVFPLLYAREADRVVEALEEIAAPNRLKKVLKQYEPIKRMVYQGRGAKVRALFDRQNLPHREQAIRNRIRREGLWMR